jgi:hypothetical protein
MDEGTPAATGAATREERPPIMGPLLVQDGIGMMECSFPNESCYHLVVLATKIPHDAGQPPGFGPFIV